MTVRYRIAPASPEAHLFDVTLELDRPAPEGQEFWLPAWIPGSYLMREFSRHVVSVEASCAGRPLALLKLDKLRWRTAPADGPITLRYRVYAFDLSVRGAYLDTTRGFFNGSSVFLAAQGREDEPCEVTIERPAGKAYKDWQVATSLARAGAKAHDFGGYCAANYDELIDHPVELGEFSRIRFKACGVPHEIVIAGRHQADMARLKKDIRKICETQIRFFGEPAPFDRYVFLTFATGDGYGGLEHRASTALICSRDDLPLAHETGIKPGYRQFLGLVSHEYFHAWNVKRIKPAAFAPYALEREGYTRLLWAFEGVTSYYDDLMLLRAGLIGEQEYLDLLAQTMTSVQRTPGRFMQNLEDSSFDAWIKYYRQDENSPNSLVSYYTKGALAALCLDLTLRQQGSSLDEVMRELWRRFGRDFEALQRGVGEEEWEAVAQLVAGFDLTGFFERALRSTDELPLAELLAKFGVESQLRPACGSHDKGGWQEKLPESKPVLGARSKTDEGMVRLTQVIDGGAEQRAGLAAGDLLVALDGLRVTAANLDTLLAGQPGGAKRSLFAFRRDELREFTLTPLAAAADTWGLRMASSGQAGRKAWLGG